MGIAAPAPLGHPHLAPQPHCLEGRDFAGPSAGECRLSSRGRRLRGQLPPHSTWLGCQAPGESALPVLIRVWEWTLLRVRERGARRKQPPPQTPATLDPHALSRAGQLALGAPRLGIPNLLCHQTFPPTPPDCTLCGCCPGGDGGTPPCRVPQASDKQVGTLAPCSPAASPAWLPAGARLLDAGPGSGQGERAPRGERRGAEGGSLGPENRRCDTGVRREPCQGSVRNGPGAQEPGVGSNVPGLTPW